MDAPRGKSQYTYLPMNQSGADGCVICAFPEGTTPEPGRYARNAQPVPTPRVEPPNVSSVATSVATRPILGRPTAFPARQAKCPTTTAHPVMHALRTRRAVTPFAVNASPITFSSRPTHWLRGWTLAGYKPSVSSARRGGYATGLRTCLCSPKRGTGTTSGLPRSSSSSAAITRAQAATVKPAKRATGTMACCAVSATRGGVAPEPTSARSVSGLASISS
mmetsp:Transcript_3605/g.5549  ORF Transcript_3605/g.5549 Transcript_3605/m.5549 type:complete len:220 (+) Transcript_3605:3388-4047(+)